MKFLKLLFLLLLFVAIGGFIFTLFWDMQAPSQQVEKTIIVETK